METNSTKLVWIITLNYNRAEETVACVASLKRITYPNYRLLVIDNCSTDDSYSRLERLPSGVELIKTEKNLGYTGGMNYGIKHVLPDNPDYVLMLNNDTVVEPDFLSEMVVALEGHPNAAVACGTILCDHDHSLVWYASGSLVEWRAHASHNHIWEPHLPERYPGPVVTEFVTGCMLLLKMQHRREIGFEDERYFMYLDDMEYSARVRSRGFSLLYVPASIIYHKVLDEHLRPFKLYYTIRNRMLFARTYRSGAGRVITWIYFFSVMTLKLMYWRIRKPKLYHATVCGIADYFRGNFFKGNGSSISS